MREYIESTGFRRSTWWISRILQTPKVVEELLAIFLIVIRLSTHSNKIVVPLLLVFHDILVKITVLVEIDWPKLLISLLSSQINVLSGTFILSQTLALTSVCRSRICPSIHANIMFLLMHIVVAPDAIRVQSQVLLLVAWNCSCVLLTI